jgi:hypothetical protein
MKRGILILGFLLMAGNAQAVTGNQLFENCVGKKENIWSRGYCMGYIVGALDSLNLVTDFNRK